MAEGKLETLDFDQYLGLSEKEARRAAVASNDAFVLAMTKAIRRGRERATPGTTVDLTPPIGAKRMYGILPMSVCGSPAAMCFDLGGAHSGAETMK